MRLKAGFELIPAYTMAEARRSLERDKLDGVLCSIHFDDPHMFDLLRAAHAVAPDMPFVCRRIMYSPLSRRVVDSIMTAATPLGARGFVDFNEMQREQPLDEADRAFRERVHALIQSEAPPDSATPLQGAGCG